jgi:hypothetical protein
MFSVAETGTLGAVQEIYNELIFCNRSFKNKKLCTVCEFLKLSRTSLHMGMLKYNGYDVKLSLFCFCWVWLLGPLNGIVSEKPVVSQLVKSFPDLYESQMFSTISQKPETYTYPELDDSSPRAHILLNICYKIILPCTPGSLTWPYVEHVENKITCQFLRSHRNTYFYKRLLFGIPC